MLEQDHPPALPDTPQAAGGRARAAALTAERRKEIAQKGAKARWTAPDPAAISARADALLKRRAEEDAALRAALEEIMQAQAMLAEREARIRAALGEGPARSQPQIAPAKAARVIEGEARTKEIPPDAIVVCADCNVRVDMSEGPFEECPHCQAAPFEPEVMPT
jgi:hypothetical protein